MKIKTYFSENSKFLLSFVLFFIFTFAIPANVYAGKNDSIQITKNVNTLFYISSNTTVYGAVYSSNDKSERSEKKISSKKKVSSKKKSVAYKSSNLLEQAKANRKGKEQSYKKTQDKIDDQNKLHLYPISPDNYFTRLGLSSTFKSVNFTGNYAFVTNQFFLNILKIHISKQKFHDSLSFLQFSKLLDSFLRGPPTHLFSS